MSALNASGGHVVDGLVHEVEVLVEGGLHVSMPSVSTLRGIEVTP